MIYIIYIYIYHKSLALPEPPRKIYATRSLLSFSREVKPGPRNDCDILDLFGRILEFYKDPFVEILWNDLVQNLAKVCKIQWTSLGIAVKKTPQTYWLVQPLLARKTLPTFLLIPKTMNFCHQATSHQKPNEINGRKRVLNTSRCGRQRFCLESTFKDYAWSWLKGCQMCRLDHMTHPKVSKSLCLTELKPPIFLHFTSRLVDISPYL